MVDKGRADAEAKETHENPSQETSQAGKCPIRDLEHKKEFQFESIGNFLMKKVY